MKNERIKSQLTEALYETDGLLFDFEAKVIGCEIVNDAENLYAIILNRTAFFPEGGGQEGDVGTLNDIKVTDTRIDDEGRILHYTAKEIEIGTIVSGHVDSKIRMSRMQNHGAEHLLCGLIYSKYGYDNVGFHMSKEGVVFDVDGPLDNNQIDEIEALANEAIYKNVPITISFPTVEEAMKIEYRSKLDTYEDIRLVDINGYDVCACCAPQLPYTGMIGVIKIIDYMPHRGGMRFTLVAGADCYEYFKSLHESNNKIMGLLSSKREDTAEFVNDMLERMKKQKEEAKQLKIELMKSVGSSVINGLNLRDGSDDSPELIFTAVLDNTSLRNLINECTKCFKGIVAGFIGSDEDGYRYIIATSGESDIVRLSKELNEEFDGKGGGNSQMVQGSIKGKELKIRKKVENFI